MHHLPPSDADTPPHSTTSSGLRRLYSLPWCRRSNLYEIYPNVSRSVSIVLPVVVFAIGTAIGHPLIACVLAVLFGLINARYYRNFTTLRRDYFTQLGLKTAAFNPSIVPQIPDVAPGQAYAYASTTADILNPRSVGKIPSGATYRYFGVPGGFAGIPLDMATRERSTLYDLTALSKRQRQFFADLGHRVYTMTISDDPLVWDPVIEQGLVPSCPRALSEPFVPGFHLTRALKTLLWLMVGSAVFVVALMLLFHDTRLNVFVSLTTVIGIFLIALAVETFFLDGPWSKEMRQLRKTQREFGVTEHTLPAVIPLFDPVSGQWSDTATRYINRYPAAAMRTHPGPAKHSDGSVFVAPPGYRSDALYGLEQPGEVASWGMHPVLNPIAPVMGALLTVQPWVLAGDRDRARSYMYSVAPFFPEKTGLVESALEKLNSDNPVAVASAFTVMFGHSDWFSSYRDYQIEHRVQGAWPIQRHA